MSGTMGLVAVFCALLAAAWAGLLALAEGSPTLSRSLGDPPGRPDSAVPLYRALHVSRIALLFVAAACAGAAVNWHERTVLEAWSTALLACAFLYMVADGLPRAVATLAPEVAGAAAAAARRTLGPFRPLLGLVGLAETAAQRLLPPAIAGTAAGAAQRDMLLGVFSLNDTTVSEVMTPRLDIVAVESRGDWHEVVDVLRESEHARLPVYTDSLDTIVGIVHAKDLVPGIAGAGEPPEHWQELVRPVQFVPESKTLASQLRDFQRGPAHLAIVVDEFGGTSGLITLEDVLEEVVGEIRDEYDVDEEPAVLRDGDDRFWVDGRVTLDELSALLGESVERDVVTTVGGLIYSELGRVPRSGEELSVAGFRVVVEQVVRRRVRRVYFERRKDSTVPAGAEHA
jgi:CBS domain containing-hemolysin-like protein